MSTEPDNLFDISRSLDTIDARRTTVEKNKKKTEQEGRRAQRRITRPEQFAVKTTPEVKQLIDRLATMSGESKVEVFERAIFLLEEAMKQRAKAAKGKRK